MTAQKVQAEVPVRRRVILGALLSSSVIMAVPVAMSFAEPWSGSFRIGKKNWFAMNLKSGVLDVSWLRGDGPEFEGLSQDFDRASARGASFVEFSAIVDGNQVNLVWVSINSKRHIRVLPSGTDARSASVPLVLLPIALFVIPLVVANVWQVKRDHRAELGRCLSCGYDLRGAIEPRCPECGNEVPEQHLRWSQVRHKPDPIPQTENAPENSQDVDRPTGHSE